MHRQIERDKDGIKDKQIYRDRERDTAREPNRKQYQRQTEGMTNRQKGLFKTFVYKY